ncbi:AraC family transcriptional regulator [Planococcus liqunii]|uniref:helix-turn-helix domain-containing protein n=1 Tax=Planococcus liqunii TaxID=3058394 RepID=UPI0026261139|nr:AraC family transcriptional regulator [Planococcus sp. N056]WKA52680.1 AraC family transcriptional regulator [Planococcus sp. N056]
MTTLVEASNCLLLSTDQKKSEGLWRNDPCYKFLFSLKGFMNYQSNRNEFSLMEKEFMVFNPHDEHRQLAVDDHKFLVELDAAFLNEATAAIANIQGDLFFAQTTQKHPLVEQWVHFVQQYMLLEGEAGSPSSEVFLEHSFAQLSLLLVKSAIGTHTSDLNTDPFRAVQPALIQVVAALKDDYQHAWTLEEMAALLGISKFQFAHLFKEKIGVSPYSWLQLYRLVRSQELLLHTKRTITDIVHSCGFSSVSVCNQLFKRLYGFPPSFFRERYSN